MTDRWYQTAQGNMRRRKVTDKELAAELASLPSASQPHPDFLARFPPPTPAPAVVPAMAAAPGATVLGISSALRLCCSSAASMPRILPRSLLKAIESKYAWLMTVVSESVNLT